MTAARRAETSPPQGREAVKRALLDAGAELFARHGPAATSVRGIAEAAGVNHGLVHRHFGSKEGLLRAVLDDLASGISREMSPSDATVGEADGAAHGELAALLERTFVAVAERPLYFRVLAQALLDGRLPEGLQSDFPVVRRLVEATRRAQRQGIVPADIDAKMLVATSVATGLGWVMFEPYLLAATGQRRLSSERARRELVRTWVGLGTAARPALGADTRGHSR